MLLWIDRKQATSGVQVQPVRPRRPRHGTGTIACNGSEGCVCSLCGFCREFGVSRIGGSGKHGGRQSRWIRSPQDCGERAMVNRSGAVRAPRWWRGFREIAAGCATESRGSQQPCPARNAHQHRVPAEAAPQGNGARNAAPWAGATKRNSQSRDGKYGKKVRLFNLQRPTIIVMHR